MIERGKNNVSQFTYIWELGDSRTEKFLEEVTREKAMHSSLSAKMGFGSSSHTQVTVSSDEVI